MSTTIILPNVRLSHPHLWVPAQPMAGSTSGPKYDGSFIFAPDSEAGKAAQQAFMQEAQKTFGANFQALVGAMDKGKKCLRNGNSKLNKDGQISNGYEGMLYLVAKNSKKPIVIAKRFFNGKPVHMDEQGGTYVDGVKTDVGFPCTPAYGGCYVNAKVEIYAMNKPGIQGVYATLNAVQFHADGESFGGGTMPSADGFEEGDFGEERTDVFGSTAAPAANLFG